MKKFSIYLLLARKMGQYGSMLKAYVMNLINKFNFVSSGLKIPTVSFKITPSKTFVLENQSPSVYYITSIYMLLSVFLRTNYSSTGILNIINNKKNL